MSKPIANNENGNKVATSDIYGLNVVRNISFDHTVKGHYG
jgi:hypothetical protein